MLAYNRANREVAILCNHQRSVPKGHESQVGKIDTAIVDLEKELKAVKKDIKDLVRTCGKKRRKKERKATVSTFLFPPPFFFAAPPSVEGDGPQRVRKKEKERGKVSSGMLVLINFLFFSFLFFSFLFFPFFFSFFSFFPFFFSFFFFFSLQEEDGARTQEATEAEGAS